jgi:hypothetical protein
MDYLWLIKLALKCPGVKVVEKPNDDSPGTGRL